MISVLQTIFPVFLLLGAGYMVARLKYLPDTLSEALNAYALKLAVPALLFLAMYRLDFSKAFHGEMLLSFYVGAFSCFFIGILSARLIWKRRPGESVAAGFCALFSNTVLLGIPIAERAFGEVIAAPVFGIIALHASLTYSVGMTTMELARRDGRNLGETFKAAFASIAVNPLMAGIVFGLLANFFGLYIPEPAEAGLDMLATSAIPVSLVGIGIALTRYAIKSELAESLVVSTLALVVHPAITFVLARWVFELPVLYVQAAVLLAAMPPGMNVYIFATIYNRAVGLSASVIVIANMLAIVTTSCWLLILQGLG